MELPQKGAPDTEALGNTLQFTFTNIDQSERKSKCSYYLGPKDGVGQESIANKEGVGNTPLKDSIGFFKGDSTWSF